MDARLADLRRQAAEAEARLVDLAQQLDGLMVQRDRVRDEVAALEARRSESEAALALAQQHEATLRQEVEETTARQAAAEAAALDAERRQAEAEQGFAETADQVTALLDRENTLVKLIAAETEDLNEQRDVLLLARAGILYPFYRVSPILDSLSRLTRVATVLCYPGRREGQTGLHFLNHQDALRGYRQRIF